MDIRERILLQRQIILDAHQKHIEEWNKAGEAGMGLYWFCRNTLWIEESINKYFNIDSFPVPTGEGDREALQYMKKFILDAVIMHTSGLIDLHDKSGPFEYIDKSRVKNN